ncbi:Coiled-coil domain-containing protein 194 [Lemmus lemmus]
MAEPGPEPGRAWRLLALCGAAVFLAAAAAGGALVAWNLAASTARGTRCPEPEQVNATVWPPDSAPEIEELRRRLAEAEQRQESLAGWLQRAEGDRRELEVALKACKDRQSRLQTQLKTLRIEMDEAKAQGTQMGLQNGELTGGGGEGRLEEEGWRGRAWRGKAGSCNRCANHLKRTLKEL